MTGKRDEKVGECEVDGRLFHLMEINEYTLPLVSLFVNETQTQDLSSTEIAWYHQQMIAELVERCKSGDRLALWAYQVIREQDRIMTKAESVMDEIRQAMERY